MYLASSDNSHRAAVAISRTSPAWPSGVRTITESSQSGWSAINSPAETLQDAAVKLRRLSAYLNGGRQVRLLGSALAAVERVVERA